MNTIFSDLDLEFIKEFETGSTKPKLTVFLNPLDGNKEIGFGHVLTKYSTLQIGDSITAEQAEEFFKQDVEKAVKVYGNRINWSGLTANQKRAIISHAYNTGARSETIIKLVSASDFKTLSAWWRTHYITSGGKRLNGLIRRRNYEADLLIK